MFRGMEGFTLFSEDAKKLAAFYQEKVGLKTTLEAEMGDKGEEIYGFEIGGGNGFYVGEHSEVKGKNTQPERVIFNLEVDDIEKEAKRLEEAGVKQIRDIYHVEGYGLISTFEDLDGNYFQLVQVRPR